MVLHSRLEREYFGQVSSLIYEPVKWLSLNINEMYTVMMMENTKRVETQIIIVRVNFGIFRILEHSE